jgi:glyoxylase-like metal-dependent hydrolase (beta-lactamase superfamily II)
VCAIVLASLPLLAAAQQAPDPLVRPAAIAKLAPHTWVIPDGNVPLVPNVGIIVGSRAVLVIDPGLGRANGETVLREVERLAGPGKAIYLASTHFHAEHTTGALAFPPSATYVNARAQEEEFAEGGDRQIALFAARSPKTAELLAGAVQRKADRLFEREWMLDLGDVHARLFVVGPAHTRGDTAIMINEDRVLFAGDVVMNHSFLAAGADASMRGWLNAFDAFDALSPRMVVPSHGAVGDGTLVQANREVMLVIQARVVALKTSGVTQDEAAATVQREQAAAHPGWPRVNGVAAAARAAFAEAR